MPDRNKLLKKNGLAETTDFIPVGCMSKRKAIKINVLIAAGAVSMGVFIGAYLGSASLQNNNISGTKNLQEKTEDSEWRTNRGKKFNASDWSMEISREAKLLYEKNIVKILNENMTGVFIIKDNESQIVIHNQAAIGSKNGFIPLRTDVFYKVYGYFIYKDVGYGICDDGNKNMFLAVWQAGKNDIPMKNPEWIRVISGRKVATRNFLP